MSFLRMPEIENVLSLILKMQIVTKLCRQDDEYRLRSWDAVLGCLVCSSNLMNIKLACIFKCVCTLVHLSFWHPDEQRNFGANCGPPAHLVTELLCFAP